MCYIVAIHPPPIEVEVFLLFYNKTVRAFKRENEDGSIDVLVVKRNFSQETIQEVDEIKLNFFKLHFPANKEKV